MAELYIKLSPHKKAHEFMLGVGERIKATDLYRSPFEGGLLHKQTKEAYYYHLNMTPIYPKIYYVGIMLVLGTLILTEFRPTWWLTPGVLISMTFFFWTPYFYQIFLMLGLRKAAKGCKLRITTAKAYNLA